MTERDRIIFERGVIYDEMSKALTECENNVINNHSHTIDDCENTITNLYAILCVMQRHWEDIITANCD